MSMFDDGHTNTHSISPAPVSPRWYSCFQAEETRYPSVAQSVLDLHRSPSIFHSLPVTFIAAEFIIFCV